jgi:hypothetical protein
MLQNRPIALTLIAAALMYGGVDAILGIVGSFSVGRININLAFLLLPAGIGLLRLSDAWRKFTLVCLGLAGAFIVGLIVYECIRPGQMPVTWFGQLTHGRARYYLFGGLVAIFGFLLGWVFHTLTRPEIRSLFAKGRTSRDEKA